MTISRGSERPRVGWSSVADSCVCNRHLPRVLGFYGLGFRVLGFRVLGFRDLGFRVLVFRVEGFRV